MNGFLLIAEWEMKIKVSGKPLCICSTDEVGQWFSSGTGARQSRGLSNKQITFQLKDHLNSLVN